MLVPPTAMDKDDFTPRWEDKVGTPRQLRGMQAVAVSKPMNKPTDNHLRLSVLASDLRHQSAALFSGDRVHLNLYNYRLHTFYATSSPIPPIYIVPGHPMLAENIGAKIQKGCRYRDKSFPPRWG
jgi:hypothetical protein